MTISQVTAKQQLILA